MASPRISQGCPSIQWNLDISIESGQALFGAYTEVCLYGKADSAAFSVIFADSNGSGLRDVADRWLNRGKAVALRPPG